MTNAMSITDFTIEYPSAGWSLRHPVDAVNGPRHLCVDGHELLHSFLATTDASAVDALVLDKSRIFRKSGSAVFESVGHFHRQDQHQVRQVIRYAGNCGRITLDLHWGRGDSKTGVIMSLLRLPGEWRRMLIISPTDGAAQPAWRELPPGLNCSWQEVPLSLVFQDQAGRRVEYSTGFDLWRWRHGLGVAQAQMEYSLRVTEDELLCYRLLLPADAGVEPQLRDYRFCSMLAWSAPALTASMDSAAPALQPLAFLPDAAGVDCRGASGERGAYSIDFSMATKGPTARRLGLSGERLPQLCWGSKATVALAKRVIRQLAAAHNGGTLRLLGMTPGLCHDGAHCERRQPTMHWDLQDLLNFAAWARQTLGDDWILQIPQPAPWNELPSLAAMGAISGFRQDQG